MEKLSRGPALNQAIQDQIKQYIINSRLEPGALLPPEGQLAVDLGVSRGSVREAIKALESLRIVEVRRGDGVRVKRFNFEAVFDLLVYALKFDPLRASEVLKIRIWLETAAVREATNCISEAELDRMEALLDRWQQDAAANADSSDHDRNFHRLLYLSLGNDSLLGLIDMFWVVYHSISIESMGPDRDPLDTVKMHRQLLAAVRAGDAALASQRMRDHFRNLEARMERAVLLNQAGAGTPGRN